MTGTPEMPCLDRPRKSRLVNADMAPQKRAVHDYWNTGPCESDTYWRREGGAVRWSDYVPLSREYFDAMEAHRYQSQPDIFGFAQFTRYHGKRVLEIGVGSGTDFLQWVRVGAEAHGVDLTQAAIEMTRAHLKAYGLSCADLRTADAEDLPFADNTFDLVYSWGVLHHTPDTMRAIDEAVRVTKSGGTVKLMLYNRHSIATIKSWIKFALLKGKPFRSFAHVLYHHMESIGTKAFTQREIRQMVAELPVENVQIDSAASAREFGPAPDGSLKRRVFFVARYGLAVGMGLNNVNFFMKIKLDKKGKA